MVEQRPESGRPETPVADDGVRPPSRTRLGRAADTVVALALLALLAFAPGAYLVAGTVPVSPVDATRPPAATDQPAGQSVHDLPVGLPSGFAAVRPADLGALARAALGPDGSETLLGLLAPTADPLHETAVGGSPGFAPYPYRYPAMTQILDEAPGNAQTTAAATLGAALLALASRPGARGKEEFPNSSAAAFAVLDRARAENDCGAQLNLLQLVSADAQPRDAIVREEAARAESVCTDDPTPGWLLVQYQSQRAMVEPDAGGDGDRVPTNAQNQAAATATRLARRFPHSAGVISALADVHLRNGIRLTEHGQPFTARQAFRTAATGYARAEKLGASEARTGHARALLGLGEPARAAALIRASMDDTEPPGPLLELLISAEEAAHKFASVESTARQFAERGSAAYPNGSQLFAVPGGDEVWAGSDAQDPLGPQSVGTARSVAFTVNLQPDPGGQGATGTVEDLSFIPTFRPDDQLLASKPSCPDAAWRRAAVLAGHPRSALDEIPSGSFPEFQDVRPTRVGLGCYLGVEDFRDIARLEAGLGIAGDRERQDQIADQRQNMWRWAGDFSRAERKIQEWTKEAGPAATLPLLRLGEVQFLQRRYADAAETFHLAARRIRQASWGDDLGVAQALLKRGAALLSAGRRPEAMALLRTNADQAERGVAFQRTVSGSDYVRPFAAVAYHSHVQLADAERESGELRSAIENYDSANDMLAFLATDDPQADLKPELKPERLHANRAVAELSLGRIAAAKANISRALSADPKSPAFLMTAGFVADRSGKIKDAERYNAAALASDAGAFPAANDLGVQLARQDRNEAARKVLRRAVGARPDYALGWFNLGVVYSQSGPAYLLHSQGSFARAFQLDDALRDRPREPTIDTTIYRTGLDLSKPLPPRWSFSQLQNLTPAPSAGLLAAVVLGLALARRAGSTVDRDAVQGWLESSADRLGRVRWLNRLHSPWWALAATIAVFVLPLLFRSADRTIDVGLVAVGVLVLGMVALRARILVARRAGQTIRNRSWGPGIAFGLATAAVAPWAPLPVTRAPRDVPRVHAAAPTVLALVGILLFIEFVALGLPFTRSVADAALVMVASVLVPITPLDGAKLSTTGLLAGAGAVGAAVLITLELG